MTESAMRPASLRRQFAKVMLLGVLVPALLLIAGLVWLNLAKERAGAEMRTASVAVSTAREVDDFIAVHRAAVNVLAQRRSAEGSARDPARWSADLARVRTNYPGFVTMLVTDARGVVRASDPPLAMPLATVRSVADRAYFREPKRTGRAYVSDAFRGRSQGTDPLIAISAPLQDAGGFAGVVEGSIRTDTIAAQRIQALQGRGYEVLLLDGTGHVILASDGVPLEPLASLVGTGLEPMLGARDLVPPTRLGLLQGVLRHDGDAYAARAVLASGWQLFVLVPKRLLDAEVRGRILAPMVLLLLFVLGVSVASWLQMHSLQAGIGGLLQTLQGFALGGTLTRHDARGMPTELQPIVSGIHQLGDRLNSAYADLKQALDRQSELAASLRTVVATREREIAERTEELSGAVAELDRISRTDELTGCLNYRGYRETATGLWEQSMRQGQSLSVLAMDIDFFKSYNDRYGHPAGDNALRRFAGAVRSSLYRGSDTLVRTGGEEFVVFLPDTSLEQATEVADRIRASVAGAAIVHEESPGGMLTVSIGVATREGGDGDDLEAMLRRADRALYQAKHSGRDRVSTVRS
ncbi:diguanylate cyclase [Lysobacter koreensis]|uniref:diguanylate cyclase n=1 Tax=Lysobacter koreensis TaxID=266122 RepID=A0ABW2YLJ0_9GAMM